MKSPRQAQGLFGAVGVLALAAVAVALVSQHHFGMPPCPWCVLERLIFVISAAVALIGLLRWRALQGLAAAGVLLLALCGAAATLWQHFVAAVSASCKLGLADRIMQGLGLSERFPAVFAPYASCGDAAVSLLGVPYEFCALALFVVFGVGALWVLLGRPARR
jgi:disulfide bond formation protein DsbB